MVQQLPTGIREKAARAVKALRTPVLGSKKRKFPADAEDQEMEYLFLFPKKRKLGKRAIRKQSVWKHRFVCLAYTDQTRIPTSDLEKDELLEAGLGEKEIEFFSQDMSFEDIKDVLYDEFPRLRDGGGFQLLKGVANSHKLEPLSKMVYTSLKVLRQRVGQGRTYIRPIQRHLDITPIFKVPDVVSFVHVGLNIQGSMLSHA